MSGVLEFVPALTEAQIMQAATLANTIWHECFAEILSPQQIDYMVDKFQSAPAMTHQIHDDGYEYFLINIHGEPGGYLSIQAKDNRLLLSKLYMLACHRGKGYSKEIMAFVEEAGRARKCLGVWLTVNRYNKRAIALYHKTGYQQTREEVKDIGGGFVMDDYIFEKPI